MPDTIHTADYKGPTHWMIEKFAVGHGKTACGRVLQYAITGGGIVSEIDCKRCIAALRKDGWQV